MLLSVLLQTALAAPSVALLDLSSGAFPANDVDAALVLPEHFDASKPYGLVLWFHGFEGCVAVAVGDEDAPCIEGGPTRRASGLASSLEASGANAALLAIELRVDRRSNEVGALEQPDHLRALVTEALAHAQPPLSVEQLQGVIVAAHSGGFRAAARSVTRGGLPIQELHLYDALYGEVPTFADWLTTERTADTPVRAMVLFTPSPAGTAAGSHALAAAVTSRVPDAAVDQREVSEPLHADAYRATFVFEQTEVPHGELPQAYFSTLLRASGLPQR